ncbi:MAG: SUMF1/EgtB/PvdO family nonheme iron enzyme, partial [Myxococcota bacterium]
AWGLYDLTGNVDEWTDDTWVETDPPYTQRFTGPVGDDSHVMVSARGWAWLSDWRNTSDLTVRDPSRPYQLDETGFRLVRPR